MNPRITYNASTMRDPFEDADATDVTDDEDDDLNILESVQKEIGRENPGFGEGIITILNASADPY